MKTVAEGTTFVTLDEVERKLSDKDLMICNTEEPMCIAGDSVVWIREQPSRQ